MKRSPELLRITAPDREAFVRIGDELRRAAIPIHVADETRLFYAVARLSLSVHEQIARLGGVLTPHRDRGGLG